MIIDLEGKINITLDTCFGNKRGKVCSKLREYQNKKLASLPDPPPLDMKQKVILNAYHPKENIVAFGSHNCIFIFNEEKKKNED